MSTPTIISKPTIQALIFDTGIDVATAAVELPDAEYAIAAIDWIANDFARALVPWRNEMIGVYAPGGADCDDFAEAAAFFAHLLFRRTPNRPKGTALGFGQFWYCKHGDQTQGHAINAAVCRDGDTLRLVYFEPQLAQLITLTPKEIASCSYIGF